MNNTDGNANLLVLWLDDGKTAQDMVDDMGTQPAGHRWFAASMSERIDRVEV